MVLYLCQISYILSFFVSLISPGRPGREWDTRGNTEFKEREEEVVWKEAPLVFKFWRAGATLPLAAKLGDHREHWENRW